MRVIKFLPALLIMGCIYSQEETIKNIINQALVCMVRNPWGMYQLQNNPEHAYQRRDLDECTKKLLLSTTPNEKIACFKDLVNPRRNSINAIEIQSRLINDSVLIMASSNIYNAIQDRNVKIFDSLCKCLKYDRLTIIL